MTGDGMEFWVVYHCKMTADDDEIDDDEFEMSRKTVGHYSSEEEAHNAIIRMRNLPGFRDWPYGFRIAGSRVNHDVWRSGFGFDDDDPDV